MTTKKKAQKDEQDVLHQFTQTIRAIDLKQKAQNEKGLTNADGEFVQYKGLPPMINPLPTEKLLGIFEKGKKKGKVKMTRDEFESLFEPDTGDHGEPEGTFAIEIEIIP